MISVKRKSWQEQIRTISSVITAVCLLFISISIVTTGVYVVGTVSELQKKNTTKLMSSMISDIGDTVHTIHRTTHMLGSSNMKPLLSDFHRLIVVVEELGLALNQLHVDKILQESEIWRNMSTKAIISIAKTLF